MDQSISIVQGAMPAGTLTASPLSIDHGGASTLSWNVTSGDFISGMISHDAMLELPTASGSVMVSSDETITYFLLVTTEQGGFVVSTEVAVDDQPAEVIFVDGFESGSTSQWSSSS